MYKIIGSDQKEYGPISSEQLRQWITEGRVNGQTAVQPEGEVGWKPLSLVAEFADILPKTLPPSSSVPPTYSAAPVGEKMPNYLVQAILCTLCCCLPLGIVAIVYAAQVNGKLQAGDYEGAAAASKNAKMWCWISFGLGILASGVWAALQFAIGVAGSGHTR